MAKKVRKKALGLGIKALLQDYEPESNANQNRGDLVRELNADAYRVPVDAIEPNPYQPRTHFDQEALEELAASIKSLGVIQPLTVRRLNDNTYQLISGERRLRASKLAGLTDVPAYVRIADDQGMLEMAIVENIQRDNLNPIEVAIGYHRLIDEVGLTHEELSTRTGKRRSTITNTLRLLKLPPEIQQALKQRTITAGHGRALAAIDDIALQLALLRQIEQNGMSVRQTEQEVKRMTTKTTLLADKSASTRQLSPVLVEIQQELTANFGSKVQLKRKKSGNGQVIINFKNDQEFNRILDQLRGE